MVTDPHRLPAQTSTAPSPAPLKRILYLEDDPSISEIALMSLTEFADFEVEHHARGSLAVAGFETFNPDLLLFDMMLPGMDGIQTLEKIREKPEGQRVPVIFMTAKAQTHEQQRYMEMGAIGVIVKPFDAFLLGERIKSIWSNRPGQTIA